MAKRSYSLIAAVALTWLFLGAPSGLPGMRLGAQVPTPATAATTNLLGTIKMVAGNGFAMTTDKGAAITVTIADGAKVLQLAGSTDLKTAKPSLLSEIVAGDRVLVTGSGGDAPDTFTAKRVILMKASDIAQRQAEQQADWKARGAGGIVDAVDLSTGSITIAAGSTKTLIHTSSKTDFRRFAGDSVKYQDAKPGTLSDIRIKDQLQARGTRSADGSVQAEDVISGSFENLSGVLISVDPAASTISFKDLATKKMVTVNVTSNSEIRNLPPQAAARFASQSSSSGRGGRTGEQAAGQNAGSPRSAGADLSQMIGKFPIVPLAELHKGDAVIVVASQTTSISKSVTAVTVLTGVDPILTANPNGGMDLAMSMGGGGGQ